MAYRAPEETPRRSARIGANGKNAAKPAPSKPLASMGSHTRRGSVHCFWLVALLLLGMARSAAASAPPAAAKAADARRPAARGADASSAVIAAGVSEMATLAATPKTARRS